MEKTNKINKDLLCAQILWEGGLDKNSLIQILIEDYYADANDRSTYSIYQRFKNNILTSHDKPKYSKNFEEMLEKFYNSLIRETDIHQIKKDLCKYMKTQEVWSFDFRATFEEYKWHLAEEFEESDEYSFDWKVDELVMNESI